ncbi:MAG: FAD-dependent thymidylate synthase [Acidobacteriaceae bacterium]
MQLYVISRPTIDWQAVESFLRDHTAEWRRTPESTAPDELVELAGRLCYFSFGKHQSPRTNHAYIANLIARGHDSVLEHSVWTFILTGVSRSFTHQLVRHRVGVSFSQLSQQYYDEADAEFVPPPELRGHPSLEGVWQRSVEHSLNAYRLIAKELSTESFKEISDKDVTSKQTEVNRAIRSAARSVLPNATESKVVMTINARALRHFLRMRGSIIGDAEMRIVAAKLLGSVLLDAPSLFGDFYTEDMGDGSPIVRQRETYDVI